MTGSSELSRYKYTPFPSYSSIEFMVGSSKFVTGSERLKKRHDKRCNIILQANYRFEDEGVANQTALALCRLYSP